MDPILEINQKVLGAWFPCKRGDGVFEVGAFFSGSQQYNPIKRDPVAHAEDYHLLAEDFFSLSPTLVNEWTEQ